MNTPKATNSAKFAWGVLAALIGLCVALFWGSWWTMADQWLHSETYSHGILIAPISAWLIWRERANLVLPQVSWSWLGLLLLLASAVVWLLGILVSANLLQHLGVAGMVIAAFPLALGRGLSLQLLFPIVFLVFMVPAGEFMNPILMEYTADATVWALRATGVAVYREGLHFALPTGRWSVVEACSGLRYIIAAGVLALLFAYLNFKSLKRKVIFVFAAVAVSIFANYVRAYTVVLVGHLTNMRHGVGDDHVWYGWVFFGIVMAAVAWAGGKYADQPTQDLMRASGIKRAVNGLAQTNLFAVAFAALAMVAFALAPAQLGSKPKTDLNAAKVDAQLTALTPSWSRMDSGFAPAFKGERYRYQIVSRSDPAVESFVSLYFAQSSNPKMITEINTIVSVEDGRWSVRRETSRNEALGTEQMALGEIEIYRGETKRLVWFWYSVGGQNYVGKARAKLGILPSVIGGFGDLSTVSTLATDVTTDVDVARKALRAQLPDAVKRSKYLSTTAP
jgi:exosortase A